MSALAAALLLFSANYSLANAAQHLTGHVPRPVQNGLVPLGPLAGTNHLRLALTLPLANQAALNALLHDVYDPGSANFHHFLKPREFADMFGPSQADYDALKAYAASNGVQVLGTHPNRTVLDVDLTVAEAERLFNVHMNVYQHPTENRHFYAPDSEPTVSTGVPLLHIDGLSDYVKPKPALQRNTSVELARAAGASAPGSGSGPFGTYMGYDFRDAYLPGVSLTGAGQTVALFEMDGYYPSDITAYESQAKVPNVPLTNVLVDGFNGFPFTSDGNSECSLDIEMAIDMAPGLSGITVYETTNGGPTSYITDTLNKIATDGGANQISSSWLIGDDPSWDQIYQEYALQGQSFYQAAGDNGAFVWSDTTQQQTDTPYATLVGGTSLSTSGPLGGWMSETVWNWNSTGYGTDGGGGGISPNYPIPSWQQGINMNLNDGSTVWRDIPDVALTADNIWVAFGLGQSGDFGGTSCAAPLWAGLTALMNQQATSLSKPLVGFLNPTIYPLAEGPLYGSIFHDITTGNNTNSESPSQFYASRGYDLCTGWGTPAGTNIINAVVPPAPEPILAVYTNYISGGNGNGVIDFDECNNLNIVLTNEGDQEATSVTAILSSLTPGAIVAQTTVSYPDIPAHFAITPTGAFTLSTEPTFICGTPIDLMLIVKSAQTIQTNIIELSSGLLGSPDTFTNVLPPGSQGTPVPVNFSGLNSTIAVSGLDSVGKLTVSVYLQALYDAGISLQLTSPNGTSVILSQNNGGLNANYGSGCGLGSATTFDDSAPESINDAAPPYVGSFQPAQPLSAFNLLSGTNLNGNWTLNIVDEFPGDTATLECWSLNISPEVCEDGGGQCPGSDLSLTMASLPGTVQVGSNFVYQMVVSNAGPATADNIVISQSLPNGVEFVNVTNYPATASISGGTNLNLTLSSIPVYGTATVDVVVSALTQGLLTSVATVGSAAPDNNPNNNTASATTFVTLPSADVAVTMTAVPSFVLEGAPLIYTMDVTNNGPSTASNVVLTVALPPDVNVISAASSQGTASANNSIFDLGTVPVGTNATVTILVLPTTTGNLTASAIVALGAGPSGAQQIDPIQFNNTASVTITVGPSADLMVAASVNPQTVLSASNFTYTATVMNDGPGAATSVTLNQTVPGGATLVSSSLAYSLNNGIVSWNINNLAAGSSVTLTNVFKAPTILGGVSSELLNSTFTVFGQPGDPNTNNNTVTVQAEVEPPTITIVPAGATLISAANQPQDGSIHPGGVVTIQFNLENTGNVATTNLMATLEAGGGVELPSGSQYYGVVTPGGPAVGRSFSFTAQSTNGGQIVAVLQLQDGSTSLGTVTNIFYMPNVFTFSNTNLISIPATQFVPEPASGPAGSYPSIVTASNVAGFVSKVTVTVSNLSHTYPHDINMLLVGPTGQSSVLMASAAAYSSIFDATLTFDETVTNPIPATGQLVSGTYFPTNYNPSIDFTNGPAGPYISSLAAFTGLSANGNWSLYAYDGAQGDSGGISNGWSVTITTITPVSQEADLAVTLGASTNHVVLGTVFTNYVGVTNNGPNPAPVYLTNMLSAGLAFQSSSEPFTNYVISGQTIVYSLGTLATGHGVAITNVVEALTGGAQQITVTSGSPLPDQNPANNSATLSYVVGEPSAAITASIAVPPMAVAGSNLVYALSVYNAGPSNAVDVMGSFLLTPNLSYVSSTLGSVQGNLFVCNFGTVTVGNTASVYLTVVPQLTGVMTNVWSVTAATAPTNVTAVTNVTVIYPTPVIAADGAQLVSQGAGFANGAINSNETVTVAFTLANIGSGSTTNLIATLQAGNGVTPITVSADYGPIAPGAAVSQDFSFVARGVPGTTVSATLALTDGTNSLGSVVFPFVIPMTANYTSSSAIIIPDYGPATPYPSQILVSGLSNVISQVTATLNGFSHTFPHDVNVMLVSPSGQELVLMAHAGGPYAVSNLNLTFADLASATLPETALSSGTYLPTDIAPDDVFPGFSAPAMASSMSVFNGLTPNGAWSLFVYDDTPGNAGTISQGWTLGLTAVSTVNPVARLAASMIHAPDPVLSGNFLSYQITVTNLGPDVASNVVVSDTLPASVTFSSVSVSQGSFGVNNGTISASLGSLNVGATATVVVKVLVANAPIVLDTTNVTSFVQNQLIKQSPQSRSVPAGSIVNTATVTTADTDLYLADSTAENNTQLSVPLFGLLATNMPSGLQLTLVGQSSQNYAIQVSTNLLNWNTVITTTTDLNGSFIYNDPSTNSGGRYYRAVLLPQ